MGGAFGTKEDWQAWVKQRDASLKEPYGWLSLVELDWLDETPKDLENFPGKWSADGTTITAVFDEDDLKVYRDGSLVGSPLTIEVTPGESDRSLRDETGREIEVMYRYWSPAVRVRDPKARRLEEFEGVDRYDFNKTWVLRGRLLPFDGVRQVAVPTAIEGGTSKLDTWATADFALPGDDEPISLIVTGDGPEGSSVFFYDDTNGDTTPGWRAAHAVIDGETVVVDFNRATLFPAHMSPFGTCPKPPEGNRIPRRVEAGEKKPLKDVTLSDL